MCTYYKVVILKIGILETCIIDERHFGCKKDALTFAEEYRLSGAIPVIVEM